MKQKLSGMPVIVVGSPRSGTSGLTHAIRCLGIYLGEDSEFFQANPMNEIGFYELGAISILNRKIFQALGMDYERVKPLDDDWEDHPVAEQILDQIDSVLLKHFAGRALWGWKDPATSTILPLYQKALARRQLKGNYAIGVRNPLEIAESIVRATAFDHDWSPQEKELHSEAVIQKSLGLWVHFMLSALRFTHGESRTLFLYEDYLKNQRAVLERIVSKDAAWKPSEAEWTSAISTLRPDLRHQSVTDDAISELPKIVRATYELCKDGARDPALVDTDEFRSSVTALYARSLLMRSMFADQNPYYGEVKLRWPEAGAEQQAQLAYLPTGMWQPIRIRVPAPAGAELRGTLYPGSSVAWVRNAFWVGNHLRIPATLWPAENTVVQTQGAATRYLLLPGQDQVVLQKPTAPGLSHLEFDLRLQVDMYAAMEVAAQASKLLRSKSS
jgi:hypothetical protein